MAPEQIDGKNISAKSDVFALGKAGRAFRWPG